jgi:TPR repeat protein
MRRYPDVARFPYQAGRIAFQGNDDAKAGRLFRLAAGTRSAAALAGLGMLYLRQHDDKTALGIFMTGVTFGDPGAMLNLGDMYNNGLGIAADRTKARDLYELAAAFGVTEAMVKLGNMYAGDDDLQNYDRARMWYEKAAARGETAAMLGLGVLYANADRDYGRAITWYERAIAAGDSGARQKLSSLCSNDDRLSDAEILSCYQVEAGLGDASAMYTIGGFYEEGRHVERDSARARDWYQKAADLGYVKAKQKLGRLK